MHNIIGIKLYKDPENLNRFLEDLKELNINSVFLGDAALNNPQLFNILNNKGFSTYYIHQTFYNPEYLKSHPTSYALTQTGEIAKDEWVEFICPTDRDYLNFLKSRLNHIVTEYNPTGISLDFIRQFIFWEKIFDSNSPRLVKSCCCPRCVTDGRNIEEIITDVVKELSSYIRTLREGIQVDLHSVPWMENEYTVDGLSLSGQNLGRIGNYVDFITPMCYSHMLMKSPTWINELVKNQHSSSGVPVIPAIQAKECYIDDPLTPKALEEILQEALKEPSKGVIVWSWDNITTGLKRHIFKRVVADYIGY